MEFSIDKYVNKIMNLSSNALEYELCEVHKMYYNEQLTALQYGQICRAITRQILITKFEYAMKIIS